ncbi:MULTISPECIES: hypothetical protein [unclassified Microcoleus]|uniref:hypothetical protein n=1 Tax=unclassified Microcoleus TaxID=2642155 RepID=UPI002FCF5DB0
MTPFQEEEFSADIPLGQVLRLPCKFIQGNSNVPAKQIEAIAAQLSKTEKNILPIVVKLLEQDNYQSVFNTQILDGARLAKKDFVWCIIVDESMLAQVQIESGLVITPPIVATNILVASEQEIHKALERIKAQDASFKNINPKEIAKKIIQYRKTKKPKNINFLTTLKCGIGKAKISTISEFFTINNFS